VSPQGEGSQTTGFNLLLIELGSFAIMRALLLYGLLYREQNSVIYLKENVMRKLISLACLGFAFAVSAPAFAGAQQEKMKGCNAEAKVDNLKGDARKAFMSKCLKKDYVLKSAAAPAKPTASTAALNGKAKQQDKMKTCNADAKTKNLKGDERKKFMSSCLKG
jgi:hypothetical protein